MKIKKILVVFGTRPEAIKMAPVIKRLVTSNNFETKICITAQHRQMLDQVLMLFDIKVDFDLNLMKKNQTLIELTSAALNSITEVILNYKPDLVVVHGDTTTTFSASLAAYYCRVPVAHIEAGLRTNNIYSPWPEEVNRRFVSCIASYHFAPTLSSKMNLIREGVAESNIYVTGNTVIDALLNVKNKIISDLELRTLLQERLSFLNFQKKIILVTGHRRENFGNGFLNVALAISKLAERDDVEIVYPLHLNPQVQLPITKALDGHRNIHLIAPLDYVLFVYLLNQAYLVITDSGGLQEEAPALGKPVLVMRETTERPEGVASGTARLVGTSVKGIVTSASKLLDSEVEYQKMSMAHNPYGDGMSADRIVNVLEGNKYESFI